MYEQEQNGRAGAGRKVIRRMEGQEQEWQAHKGRAGAGKGCLLLVVIHPVLSPCMQHTHSIPPIQSEESQIKLSGFPS
jgi:hypothetical protein